MYAQDMYDLGAKSSVIRALFEYGRKRKAKIGEDNVFDFSIGNPSVPAPEAVKNTLVELLTTTPAEVLHAYTSAAGDIEVRQAIATYIADTYHVPAEASLIYITCGAAASLTCTLTALCTPGDEVIVLAPYFPEYRVFVERTGARLVTVNSRQGDFQVDGQTLANAITPRTRAVIVNSPNNPTGAVLTEESVKTLSSVLADKGKKFGNPIYLISDEPYRELAFDVSVPYISSFYENTIVCYSFSKSLSLPGERIGYVMVSPKAQDARLVFTAICGAGRALGFVCAPALFQYMIKKCIGMTSDISVYRENRSILYNALTEYGYEAVKPDGAFYLFVKALEQDANAFCERAKQFELLLVPSDSFGCPGYVRIAYCVSTKQIISSLPAFQALAESYYKGV